MDSRITESNNMDILESLLKQNYKIDNCESWSINYKLSKIYCGKCVFITNPDCYKLLLNIVDHYGHNDTVCSHKNRFKPPDFQINIIDQFVL